MLLQLQSNQYIRSRVVSWPSFHSPLPARVLPSGVALPLLPLSSIFTLVCEVVESLRDRPGTRSCVRRLCDAGRLSARDSEGWVFNGGEECAMVVALLAAVRLPLAQSTPLV